MQLCEHLAPLYQKEIQKGNEVLAVGLNYRSGKKNKMAVFFKKIPQFKKISAFAKAGKMIEEGFIKLHTYPDEHFFACRRCKMILSFPMRSDQPQGYAPAPWAEPNEKVVATTENIYADDQISETGIRPTVRY